MRGVEIRKATKKDAKKIAELLHAYDVYEHRLDRRQKVENIAEFRKEVLQQLRNKEVMYLLAFVEEEAIGFISWSIDHRGLRKRGVIQDLFVSEGARGSGVGGRLVREVLSVLRKKGCFEVKSFVRVKNTGAREFWKKQGFGLTFIEGYQIRRKL